MRWPGHPHTLTASTWRCLLGSLNNTPLGPNTMNLLRKLVLLFASVNVVCNNTSAPARSSIIDSDYGPADGIQTSPVAHYRPLESTFVSPVECPCHKSHSPPFGNCLPAAMKPSPTHPPSFHQSPLLHQLQRPAAPHNILIQFVECQQISLRFSITPIWTMGQWAIVPLHRGAPPWLNAELLTRMERIRHLLPPYSP